MSQVKNLPSILLSNDYKKFKSKENTIIVSSDRYLGVSSNKPATNRISDFIKR